MMKPIWILMVLLIGWNAYAEDIEVPEEELARETTLPVFSKRRIVLNRNVVTTEKYEFGLGGGMEMNEPYYSPYLYGFQGTYNFTDVSAVNVQGIFWSQGLSSYGQQLKQGKPTVPTAKFAAFDTAKVPHPTWAAMVNYEFIAYYGKISITKQAVANLNTFGLLGLGYLSMDTVSTVAADFGVGQNFFFTQHMGVRWDLKWLVFQGPDATSKTLGPNDHPAASDFSNRIYYNSQLDLALVFIL
jgi:outer membrane beta-barrel protein